MIKTNVLKPGDGVALVAPASPFKKNDFDRGVRELRRLGLKPIYDDSVFSRSGYLAGTPEVRARAIQKAWHDPDVSAILGVRGGYGSVQVLPFLEPQDAIRAQKPFIGYSDLTSILIYLTSVCGITCFHGPTLCGGLSKEVSGYDEITFVRSLMSTEPLGELQVQELETVKDGDASGVLLGGTLTQILSSLSTPFAFNPPDGYVLFVDEIGERPYRIDRLLTQFRLSGLLQRASAVVFGELPGCDEPSGLLTSRGVVDAVMSDFNGPVLFGLPSGHATVPSITLPFGVRARVIGGGKPRMILEESAVQER